VGAALIERSEGHGGRGDGDPAKVVVRTATKADLRALERLEEAFPGDRISRASFARFLALATADVWVATIGDVVVGDAVVVYRRGYLSARLYTLVVSREQRGRGIARALLERCEAGARERGCVTLRLEVREDNDAAIALYRRAGYDEVGRTDDYYEDGSTALRMRKRFVQSGVQLVRVPYYAQSLEFTCGPASLMMAMRAVGWSEALTVVQEVAIWREATTVFMLSGHGGTSAHGLALAARRRGVRATVWVDSAGPAFLDSVRDPQKKAIIEASHQAFEQELARDPEAVRVGDFGATDIVHAMERGCVPVVLVSGARLLGERVPHWVVVTGWDDDHLYVHDPHLPEGGERADALHLPLPRRDLPALTRYGRAKHRAMVLVGPPAPGAPLRRQTRRPAKAAGPSTR
jgi:ribosomal protein S18 acetylase RimI-like enzyme